MKIVKEITSQITHAENSGVKQGDLYNNPPRIYHNTPRWTIHTQMSRLQTALHKPILMIHHCRQDLSFEVPRDKKNRDFSTLILLQILLIFRCIRYINLFKIIKKNNYTKFKTFEQEIIRYITFMNNSDNSKINQLLIKQLAIKHIISYFFNLSNIILFAQQKTA